MIGIILEIIHGHRNEIRISLTLNGDCEFYVLSSANNFCESVPDPNNYYLKETC